MKWIYENEINRCLLCEDAPCTKGCKSGVEPDQRIRALYFDNPYRALEGLAEDACENCTAGCERSCILTQYNQGIHIRDIMWELQEMRETQSLDNENFTASLETDICGVKLENPFILSSSVVSSNFEMCDKALAMGWGGVAFKTITLFDQHETSPRFSVLKSRTGSFYGFKNIEQLSDHAVEENLTIIKQLKEKYPTKVIIASIMGRNEQEWEYLTRVCDEAGADVIELNYSCPNMEDNTLGVTIGQDEEAVERFTKAARKGTKKPILVKLTPNVMDMVPYALRAKKGGADGIAAINTIESITGVNLDTLTAYPSVRGHSAIGGYSGNAVKPIALRFIANMAKTDELKSLHFSSMGGIENWKDALEFILLGSSSLQVTTAVMQYGYRIIDDLKSGLLGYMEERNITHISDLVGGALDSLVELNELERDTILYPKFHTDQCIGCGRCYISCYDGGHQAIAFDQETRRPTLLAKKCVGCHLCRLVCPTEAIGVVSKRVKKSTT